jgi:hypothetical protein
MQSIRVVVPNTPGLFAQITERLASRGISIEQVVVETYGDSAVVRLGVENTLSADQSLKILTEAGYNAVCDEVLLARIEDQPGALAHLSRRLTNAGLDIRSVHHVRRDSGFAVVAISTDDNVEARNLLGEAAL